MQKICFLVCMILMAQSFRMGVDAQSQLTSPDAFLGYAVGSRYTPHYKIVNYFESVAAAAPAMVKLHYYGQTNEGKPLLVAFVGSPENVARLEEIRKNNLRLTGMLDDKPGTEQGPVIVWLSYNVHGNEPSSSEAAMNTLYALVDPENQQTKEWLKNTVVVIDPCLNPDGRDRYVNWFNSIEGARYNADPQSREHQEPWPGGRSNHYNFDLNRDWFWQTQVESQQRVRLYNDWMPQIHADYHEQGYNAPYYFAPAAEPYHEVITPWQREAQVTIGKNNAHYFDNKGWLFFTKQEFDLFYPSYGDTYPLYNGSIGMTYEVAGNSSGGVGVVTENGDTLTLTDRVLRHFTTGMSTIEVASRNAPVLLKEFHAYFNRSIQEGKGPYQAYIVRIDSAEFNKAAVLKQLLLRNKIRFGTASGAIRGYDYFTKKEGGYTIGPNDLVIPGRQPKASLVKVLFEPESRISDSVTYDITAWSLPYVYGLRSYAVKELLQVHITTDTAGYAPAFNYSGAAGYGYVIPWTGISSAKALSFLLLHHVKVRVNQRPFVEQGRHYSAGSIIVLATGNQGMKEAIPGLLQTVNETCRVPIVPLASGFVDEGNDMGSDLVRPLQAPRVALLTGSNVSSTAAGEVWFLFEQELGYPISLINSTDFPGAKWSDYDVLILPDGFYPWLTDKKTSDALKTWVTQGGRLVALEGAAGQLAGNDWGFKVKKPGDDKDKKEEEDKKGEDGKGAGYALLKHYGDKDREEVRSSVPGSIYKVDMDSTHPLAYGFPSYYYSLRLDNTVYQFMEDGWNVGVLKKDNYVSGFVGSKAKEMIQDGVLFGVEEMGRGNIVFMADDPLFRDFWENGKLLFCNAVFMVGN